MSSTRILKYSLSQRSFAVSLYRFGYFFRFTVEMESLRAAAISVSLVRIQFAQAGLFQPLASEPAKLEISMARIRAVVGETDSLNRQLVGFLAVLGSHRPVQPLAR